LLATAAVVVLLGLLALLVVEVHRKVRLDHAATRAHVRAAVRETTAATQLLSLVDSPAPLPAMGDWAMQPSALLTMFHLVRRHRPAVVVELGSGASTGVLGHAVRDYGGEIVSLDHEEAFARATREAVEAHGLGATCSVVVAPLHEVTVAGHTTRWYESSALAGVHSIGMLVVDGPPELSASDARYLALPLLRDRLAPGAIIVLDDVDRDGERRILDRWDTEFPELEPVGSIAPRIAVRRVRT
jgi:predicted O-methyltransferase YrrM